MPWHLPGKRLQQFLARSLAIPVLQPEFQEIRDQGFCFPDKDKIQKRRQGFGIHKDRNPARRNKRT